MNVNQQIIFDFDGTIADSIAHNLKIINKLSRKFGYKALTEKEMKNLSHKSLRQIIKEFKIPIYKIPFIIWAAKKESKKDYLAKIKPFPGLVQVLKDLKNNGYQLDIVSSANKKTILGFLKKYKIDFFTNIISGVPIFGKKKAIRRLMRKSRKKDGFYVGDEVRDIDAAKKAGIKVISVTWGFNSEDILKKESPDFIIKKPRDILKILR